MSTLNQNNKMLSIDRKFVRGVVWVVKPPKRHPRYSFSDKFLDFLRDFNLTLSGIICAGIIQPHILTGEEHSHTGVSLSGLMIEELDNLLGGGNALC